MTQNGKDPRPPRPHLSDRVMLWLSSGHDIDGLWIGTYFQTNADPVMRRVAGALDLIKMHDRPRYDRLSRDLDKIWVRLLTTGVAQFDPPLRACLLDERFVLAESTDIAHIAAAIVHEATHARLWRHGFGYDEAMRQRVEAICLRRELAFAKKLPDGARLREWTQDTLALAPTYWTDNAAEARHHAGAIELLDHLGHGRLARLMLALRNCWHQPAAEVSSKGNIP